ncbi:hypothetical protein AVEN_170366-1 [Araneus ventricosus]|uniref:Uncharacterized protein n=1 Tax=Araneus ventricosus TaxID=182803 RepID=A0A4Y2UBB8_ARAVE|nr:hypothetical protein AVEN_170366-1 [Araneus ventricosus]
MSLNVQRNSFPCFQYFSYCARNLLLCYYLLLLCQTLLHNFLLLNTNKFLQVFCGQLLAVRFLKLIDIIFIHLQPHDFSLRHTISLLQTQTLKPLKVAFNNALRSKLLPSGSEGSFGNLFSSINYQLEAGNDVAVIFPKLSENKIVTR